MLRDCPLKAVPARICIEAAMGAEIARHLVFAGHDVCVFDRDEDKRHLGEALKLPVQHAHLRTPLGDLGDLAAVEDLGTAGNDDASGLVASVDGKREPTVGLLNIGQEDIKGNEVVKRAAELLRQSDLNFHGNIEGDDIYKGTTDVVVCDGFVGNVALKTSEGLAQMVATYVRAEFKRNLLTIIAGLVASPVLKGGTL